MIRFGLPSVVPKDSVAVGIMSPEDRTSSNLTINCVSLESNNQGISEPLLLVLERAILYFKPIQRIRSTCERYIKVLKEKINNSLSGWDLILLLEVLSDPLPDVFVDVNKRVLSAVPNGSRRVR